MVAPLAILPYLSRVLGIEGFGLVMLALSACAIAGIITDYGFNLSATYAISKRREEKVYVNEFIGAVFVAKALLVVVIAFGIIVYSYFVGFGTSGWLLPFYIGLNVVAQAFIPTWFFQGIERMKNATIYMVVAKLCYVLSVFIFINKATDVDLVILLYAMGNFVACCVAIRFVYSNGYAIAKPQLVTIKSVFKESSQFFLSRAAVSIYTSVSTFLVGTFSGVQQAALYGASEKLYIASQSITSPIAQALFPYMAKDKNYNLLIKIVIFVGIPLAIGCFVCGYWATEILTLIFGSEFSDASVILQIFLMITIINFISVNFGYPAFAGIGKVKIANYTVIVGAFIQLGCLLFLYLTNLFSGANVAVSVLVTELSVCAARLSMYYFYSVRSVNRVS